VVIGGGTGVAPENQHIPESQVVVKIISGRWEVALPRGATCTVRIPSTGFTKTFIVPAAEYAMMSDTHGVLAAPAYPSPSSFSV
jgi:hypothetical protein